MIVCSDLASPSHMIRPATHSLGRMLPSRGGEAAFVLLDASEEVPDECRF
jgi:hypothetical protein